MNEKLVDWLVNVCLLGLIPVLARFLVWLISDDGVEIIAISDLVVFGLVLQSYSINQISRSNSRDSRWKTAHNGFAITFTVLFGLLMAVTISSPRNLNEDMLLKTTAALAVASFFLALSVLVTSQDSKGAEG